MGLERYQRRIGDELQDQSERVLFITPTASGETTQLAHYNKAVIVTLTGSYTHTVLLPPVGECAGEMISIRVPDAGGGCTVKAYGGDTPDAVDWSNLSLDADNDNALLYSDGFKWFVVVLDEN